MANVLKKFGIGKQTLFIGAGAGLGIVIPAMFKAKDGQLIPQLGSWGRYSTIIPLATGLAGLFLYANKKIVKNKNLKSVLLFYGVNAVLSGVLYATIFQTTTVPPFWNQNLSAQRQAQVHYASPGYLPGWPYVSKARGYGSANAQIPTRTTGQVINS